MPMIYIYTYIYIYIYIYIIRQVQNSDMIIVTYKYNNIVIVSLQVVEELAALL
jgi:hypothetical protein